MVRCVNFSEGKTMVLAEHTQQEFVAAVAQFECRMKQHVERSAVLNFSYVGRVTFVGVGSMLELVREALDEAGNVDLQQRRRMNQIAVELLQNVSRHGYDWDARGESRRPLGYALFRVEKSWMQIVTANLCKREVAQRVQESVTQLNGLTLDQVRALHKVQLANGEISDRGGAGLGLMDVIMRSKQALGVYREAVGEGLDMLEFSLRMPTRVSASGGSRYVEMVK